MTEAERMQRETVATHPYLFQRIAGSSHWVYNRGGTLFTPVWVPCTPLEESLLNSSPE